MRARLLGNGRLIELQAETNEEHNFLMKCWYPDGKLRAIMREPSCDLFVFEVEEKKKETT